MPLALCAFDNILEGHITALHGCCTALQAAVTEEERYVKVTKDIAAGIQVDAEGRKLKVRRVYAAIAPLPRTVSFSSFRPGNPSHISLSS